MSKIPPEFRQAALEGGGVERQEVSGLGLAHRSGLRAASGVWQPGNWKLASLLAGGQTPPVEKSRGIVVRLTRLTETSLIVHWLTDDAGLIKTVARGARRAKSAFAGKLDLFFDAEIEWTRSRRGDLHALREVAVTDFREGLRKRYADTVAAGYFCALLEWAVERDHPEPELADLLRRGLGYLAEHGADTKAVKHFERELARLLGLAQERMDPAAALEAAFGRLPAARQSCLDTLD